MESLTKGLFTKVWTGCMETKKDTEYNNLGSVTTPVPKGMRKREQVPGKGKYGIGSDPLTGAVTFS